MTQKELLETAIKALDSKKAENIQLIEIKNLTIIADYFIIVSGNSVTQTRALADEVEYRISQLGLKPDRIEGYSNANWIILDYKDVVVHVFYKETRDFYSLERLWSDGENLDVKNYLL